MAFGAEHSQCQWLPDSLAIERRPLVESVFCFYLPSENHADTTLSQHLFSVGLSEYYGGDGRSTTSRGYRREYHDHRKYDSNEGSDHWSGGNNHLKSPEDAETLNSHGANTYVRGERSPVTERRQRHFQATGHQYHRYSQTQR